MTKEALAPLPTPSLIPVTTGGKIEPMPGDSRPEISVLLPAYQCEAVLGEALETLRAQSFRRFEVWVVDDGSTDGTSEVAQGLARADPRFHVLRRPHGGIVAALNAGLSRCRAPLIARMDADDRCAPERLATQHALLRTLPGPAVVGSRIWSFKSDGSPPGWGMSRYVRWVNSLLTPEAHLRERYVESPVAHSSVLLPRDLLGAGYRESAIAEDYDLWLRLLGSGVPFHKPTAPLLGVRDDPGRLSRHDSHYTQEALRRAKLDHLLSSDGPLAGRAEVLLWGAGRVGKAWLRDLATRGVRVPAVVDLHPRKLGKVIHGALVIKPANLPERWTQTAAPFLLGAVGAPGAREDIRRRLDPSGELSALRLQEGRDYLFVA